MPYHQLRMPSRYSVQRHAKKREAYHRFNVLLPRSKASRRQTGTLGVAYNVRLASNLRGHCRGREDKLMSSASTTRRQ